MNRPIALGAACIALIVGAAVYAQAITAVPVTPTDGGVPVSAAQAAAAAPVSSVNAQTGIVVVAGTVRQTCDITSFDASGNGSCALTAFTSAPDCIAAITAGNASYVYSHPIQTATTTSAAVTMQAALKLLNISLGLTTIWGPPPAGTTVRMICRGS